MQAVKVVRADSKSHKVTRRNAIRAKESARVAWWMPDETPPRATRRDTGKGVR